VNLGDVRRTGNRVERVEVVPGDDVRDLLAVAGTARWRAFLSRRDKVSYATCFSRWWVNW
jgi:hypothetical protein